MTGEVCQAGAAGESTTNTWRSASRSKKPRRLGDRKAGKDVGEHGEEHREHRRRPRREGGRPAASYRRGAFGAARLARIVADLQARLEPGQGLRPGRPTDASWVRHPKVPMSEATRRRLTRLAEQSSSGGRKVSPMQVAARILEEALAGLPDC
jgi:hypothetical protein